MKFHRKQQRKEALRRQQSAEEFQKQQALAGLGQALTPVQKFAEKKPDLLKVNEKAPASIKAQVEAENRRRLKSGLSGY